MVYPDLSSVQVEPQNAKEQFHLASVADRFLAFVFDTFLMAPVISLFVAGQLRDVRSYALERENSPEALVVWLMFIASIIMISIFLQSVFTYFWGGTPGQRILNLRVVSLTFDYHTGEFTRMSFPQAFLRSLLWWLSLALVGWPFMEVLSHSQRRCLHDRASDTLVVSLKSSGDLGPSPFEQRVMSSWMRFIFLSLFFIVSLYFMKVHQMVKGGFFSREELESKGQSCDLATAENTPLAKRLDLLLAIHILDPREDDCLTSEGDIALWNKESQDKPMGYLVRFFMAKESDQKKEYAKFICEKYPKEEVCELTKFVSEKKSPRVDNLRRKGLSLYTTRALVLKQVLKEKNFVSASALIEDLIREPSLEPYVQRLQVSLAWQIQENLYKKSRQPASLEMKEIITEFKKRFEIP